MSNGRTKNATENVNASAKANAPEAATPDAATPSQTYLAPTSASWSSPTWPFRVLVLAALVFAACLPSQTQAQIEFYPLHPEVEAMVRPAIQSLAGASTGSNTDW